jgi:predicted homoserine dehydrogenase-like protein
MNYHRHYASIVKPIEACLIGGGAYGQSFLAQARFIKRLSARIAVDLTCETAAAALLAAGFAKSEIRTCETSAQARAAFEAGHAVAAARFESVLDLPFDIAVEATGQPEAAAIHSLAAIESRRHVLLVTKETDSVAGPILAHLARAAGVGITPVDGDQPALLIDLVTWGETLGFDIVCAGKSSEYDFVFDRSCGTVTSNGRSATLPALAASWATEGRSFREVASMRANVLSKAFPLKAVPDLCEMTLVANATGLSPDIAGFHAPVARVPELASMLSQDRKHGLLNGKRRVDVFHHLRAPDEASFAGGVFITIVCQDKASWKVLAEKGHVVSEDGEMAMVYLPRHLLGLESATSVLDLAGLNRSTYPDDYAPRMDLVAVPTRDLAAGTRLDAVGHHHTIEGVTAEMRPATALSADRTTPYYLVANRVLSKPVRKGEAIRLSDLEIDAHSKLLDLRRRQDAHFLNG